MPPPYDSGFDIATNTAPSTLDALDPEEILKKVQQRQVEAEEEYNSLIKQSKLPVERYSPSQAFGASALAILPALAAYAFGGDDKYTYGALAANAGGQGAAQYLADLQGQNKQQNEVAGLGAAETARKLDDLRGLESTVTQASIYSGNAQTKADLALRNTLAAIEARGGQAEPPSETERQSLQSMLGPLGATPEEINYVMIGNTEKDRFYRAGELRRAKEAAGGKNIAATNSTLPVGLKMAPGKFMEQAAREEFATGYLTQAKTLKGIERMKDIIQRRGIYTSMLQQGSDEQKRELAKDLSDVKLTLLEIKTGLAAGNPMFKGVLSNQDVQRLDALAPRGIALMEDGDVVNFLAESSASMLGQLDAVEERIRSNQEQTLSSRGIVREEDKIAKIRSLLGKQ